MVIESKFVNLGSGVKTGKSPNIKSVKLRDVTGRVVQQTSFSTGANIAILNIANLPAGVYIIQIFDGSSWSSVELIIQK